ncbi:MAG: iron ABC transporter substrate-binding protein, partial [Ardenticatenales bacterium]|nr:iron ABC transporter substrate-binding protein [Ardenticatenales bacterium]
MTRAGRAPAQMAGRGEIAVGITFSHDCVKASEEAARTYVDWALSQAAQEIPATVNWYQLPTNPVATIPEQSASQVKLLNYDFVAAGTARSELVERFTADIAPAPPE